MASTAGNNMNYISSNKTEEEMMTAGAQIMKQASANLLKPNPRLDNAISSSRAAGLPEITVSDLAGQYLAIQCQLIGAKRVLEIGTLGGYSTVWFASTGAHVTSIELNQKHRDVAAQNTQGLDVDIILGSALDVLPKMVDEGREFDLIFIDADWKYQWEFWQWAVKLARTGGCIYVDNVVRALTETWDGGKGESLLTRVGRDERVDATLVATFSSHKGVRADNFDGFIQAVVKAK